jgi:hypothetical protein
MKKSDKSSRKQRKNIWIIKPGENTNRGKVKYSNLTLKGREYQ